MSTPRTTPSPTRPKASGQSRKVALIPILLLVLFGVLYNNSRTRQPETELTTQGTTTIASRGDRAAGLPESEPSTRALVNAWPMVGMDEVGNVNPFASMEGEDIVDPAAESNSGTGEKLVSTQGAGLPETNPSAIANQPLRYYFQTGTRRVMIVGDQLLTEGQPLGNGFQVEQLNPGQIILGPVPESPSAGAAY